LNVVKNAKGRCAICGSLRSENIDKKIGNPVPIRFSNGSTSEGVWWGHHRLENKRTPENSTLVTIPAESYTEREVEFSIPEGAEISALLVENDRFPNGSGIFIITRPATLSELKKCKHPRHPKFEIRCAQRKQS
jgi:hypothetical protein